MKDTSDKKSKPKGTKEYHYVADDYIQPQIDKFIKKCNNLNKIYNSKIDPNFYIKQFRNYHDKLENLPTDNPIKYYIQIPPSHEKYNTLKSYELIYTPKTSSSIEYSSFLQNELFKYLKFLYPELDFAIRGRTKTAKSNFDKLAEKLEDDPYNTVKINDEFANRIFIHSRNVPIENLYFDQDGIHICSGLEDLLISKGDVIHFPQETGLHSILVNDLSILKQQKKYDTKNQSTINDVFIDIPSNDGLTNSISIKNCICEKSSSDILIPYCYKLKQAISTFYNSIGFSLLKEKDYIATPKPNGYTSLQDSYILDLFGLTIETQIMTADMQKASKEDPKQSRNTYNVGSRELNEDSVYQVPRYALTTLFEHISSPQSPHDVICQTYVPDDDNCFYYTFKKSFSDYVSLMKERNTSSTLKLFKPNEKCLCI